MRTVALALLLLSACAAVEEDNSRYRTPAPTGLQPTQTPIVAAAGGTACIGQSTLCVLIPPGALSEDVTVLIRQASGVPAPVAVLAASAFDVGFIPDTATFSGIATLTYQLPSASLVGTDPVVVWADVTEWSLTGLTNQAHTPGSTVDVIAATTDHFTTFAVIDLEPVACPCDIDATCTAGCACDTDCCPCDVDATCSLSCACDLDCLPSDEPDISIVHGSYEGPNPLADCVAGECVIPTAAALAFPGMAPGSTATAELTIANRAACTGDCDTCTITVAADPGARNIGLGFSDNESNAFAIVGSVILPFDIRQENTSCSESGQVNLLVSFTAPATPGTYSGTLVIESNDPDEPVIELPVFGATTAGQPPVAEAEVRACPDTACTDPNSIAVLDRVYLDGRSSFDPDDPLNPAAITAWSWRVDSHPAGINPLELAPGPSNLSTFDFVVPAEGLYEVVLTVWDGDGLESADTSNARVVVVALAATDVQVVLTWDAATDLDLHLTYTDAFLPGADLICNIPNDCFYDNKTPVWFIGEPSGSGPNPRMDVDSNGLGPENIFIELANDGTYRIYVNYYDSTGAATNATVNVVANGNGYIFSRLLQPNEVWAVADILYAAGGLIAVVQEYPTDGGGTGAVATMDPGLCNQPGWNFPL